MLCLRRISLDAKSRLLFLSRSHSSTNDSMPKSTAISRLIHKKFLQQNGNNSPQAIFVFFQQRGLRTKIFEEQDKSAKDKDRKDKSVRRLFFNLGYGVVLALTMYTVGTIVEEYDIMRGVVQAQAPDKNKLVDHIKMMRFAVWLFWVKLRKKILEDESKSADHKNESDLFKFGFGPSGRKPKNMWEMGVYKQLERVIRVKFGKSEKEFEEFLKGFDIDKVNRYYTCYCSAPGVLLALVTCIGLTAYKRTLPSLRVFIVLFTVLPPLSYFGMRAYHRMSARRSNPMLCLRRISLDAKSRLLFLSRSHSSTNDSMPKSTAISRLIHKKFLQQNGNNLPQAIFVFLQKRSLSDKIFEKKDKSAKDKDEKDETVGLRRDVFKLGTIMLCIYCLYTEGYILYHAADHIFRNKSPEDMDNFADDLDNSDAEAEGWEKSSDDNQKSAAKDSEFKFGFGPFGRKPKSEFEKDLYWYLHQDFIESGKSEEEFEQKLKETNPERIYRLLPFYTSAPGVLLGLVTYIILTAYKRAMPS
ncbi:hypothetical protein Ddc_16371 [Ditylenchus destructor]|nr:hypothetical protein Ddc_16371 [Ditylenchus destructor]